MRSYFRPRTIPDAQRCQMCRVRYQQGHGVCRKCFRDAEKLAELWRSEAAAVARERGEAIPPAGRERREVRDRGVEFVVVWDGTDAGAQALGIPPAHLRGDPSYGRQRG